MNRDVVVMQNRAALDSTVMQNRAGSKSICPSLQVLMSRDVVAAAKAVMEPGMKLLGFKPRSYLRDHHQAGHR